jgi:glyoxylase-like metal-dependent hydrolase (beta-lactamase superfamily II)
MTKPLRPTHQPPGVYHHTVGEMTVTALNDGAFEAAFAYLTHIPPDEAEALHRASFRAIPPRITISCFLLQTDARRILVDSGCGTAMGPGLGALGSSLLALGVQPGDIDTVLATHLHPDHIGGLVDSNGTALFPNAELVVHEADLRFWGDDATLAGAANDQDRSFVQLARATITAYRDRTRVLTGGEAPAWCMYRMCSRNNPFPNLGLGRADIVRASHLQHAIEGVDSHVNLGRPTFVYT